MGVPSRTSAPTPALDQTFDIQIILGKVRPFLRRLAEAHPQVLIIAHALSRLTETPTASNPLYALVALPDADTNSLGGPRFYGGANPRFYLQADVDGDIIDRNGDEYGTPAQVRSLAAALLAVAAYVERKSPDRTGRHQPVSA
ncbi:hypothetical protein MTY66_61770 (plasmid) [Mycolicibacterium sp. TY66]|nr:hypothetical protein MTY66_61770 [Mycolicibacterium sp. TY66]BCJ84782.1 hypothetical protein MTY81_61550 [Mycolicibacterium sp. TY81]